MFCHCRFNPRTHTGCDASANWQPLNDKRFQSTHPHGVRLCLFEAIMRPIMFQSTHPHGVRLKRCTSLCKITSFNPRTHTGCDAIDIKASLDYKGVSIHAPTRGATNGDDDSEDINEFQSTHPHGVPLDAARLLKKEVKFQSTHPHGVRPHSGRLSSICFMFQSTHPHGVRRPFLIMTHKLKCFNPRTHTGCDQ